MSYSSAKAILGSKRPKKRVRKTDKKTRGTKIKIKIKASSAEGATKAIKKLATGLDA